MAVQVGGIKGKRREKKEKEKETAMCTLAT